MTNKTNDKKNQPTNGFIDIAEQQEILNIKNKNLISKANELKFFKFNH